MKEKAIIFALLFVLGAVSCLPLAAQAPGVLPGSFGGWMASSAAAQVPAGQVEQFANDKAGVLHEYGVTSAERREYTRGNDKLTITLYRMVDPSAAFGAFTFLHDPAMTSLKVTDPVSYAAGGRGHVLLVVGNLLMDISSSKSQLPPEDVSGLGKSVVAQADRRPYPPIADFLPRTDLIPGSERYVLGPLALSQVFPPAAADRGDWAGFGSSAEAMVARYRLTADGRRSEATLLLILYPTQQLAADRYEGLGKYFALNADAGQASGRPALFGTRSSALVALLSGVDSSEAATNFLHQIHYSSLVTWDAPTHELTDPSISTIVVGAIVDTGAIMLLVLAASIGFGGFRLLAKFVAPGRIFDRNAEVEILQLGINSKPVDVKDFYILQSHR
jgi:hypothetical protein